MVNGFISQLLDRWLESNHMLVQCIFINGLRSVWDMQEGEDVIEILNEIIELR